MKAEDLWERDEYGNLSWKIYGNRPEIESLSEEGFLGIAKEVMLNDFNENLKKVSVPWATDFSYSSAMKGYVVDIETKRVAWVVSLPLPKNCTFIRPFARRYNLRFSNEGMAPTTIYESDNPFDIVSLGHEKVHISEEFGTALFIGDDVKIPN